jgi:hypothetical protein
VPVFFGELQQPGDDQRLPAVVTIDQSVIRLTSGQVELGEWKLTQVVIDGYEDRVDLTAEGERLMLYLAEHERFLDLTAPYQRSAGERRRSSMHPAFRKDEDAGPTLAEELREDVSREVTSVVDEARDLVGLVKPGPPLWIGLGVLLILIVFLPTLVISLSLLGGILALLVGGAGYAETRVATKIPEPLNPVRLIVVGIALVALAIVVAIVR